MGQDIIAVREDPLKAKEQELRALQHSLQGMRFNLALSDSRGDFADGLRLLTGELENIARSLADLAGKSADEVKKMYEQFSAADELTATQFSGGSVL